MTLSMINPNKKQNLLDSEISNSDHRNLIVDLPLIEVSRKSLDKKSIPFSIEAPSVRLILDAYVDQVRAYYPDPPIDTTFANWAVKA